MRWIILICRGRNRPRELSSHEVCTDSKWRAGVLNQALSAPDPVLHASAAAPNLRTGLFHLQHRMVLLYFSGKLLNVTISGRCGHRAVLPKSEACTVFSVVSPRAKKILWSGEHEEALFSRISLLIAISQQ